MKISYNEFHVSKNIRDLCHFDDTLYSSSGNVIFANLTAVKEFQVKLNKVFSDSNRENEQVSAGNLNAMGLIDEIFHYVCMIFRRDKSPLSFTNLLQDLDRYFGRDAIDELLLQFMEEFPPVLVYQKKLTAKDYLIQTCYDSGTKQNRDNREQILEELILLHLANENPAFHPFMILFDDSKLSANANYIKTWNQIKAYFLTQPVFGPNNNSLINMLKEPIAASPTSLKGQLNYIREKWGYMLKDLIDWLRRLLEGMDTISEEEKAAWHPIGGDGPELVPYSYENLMKEYERFSPDREWMPKVVLMAKTVLVWLFQLSKKYGRQIEHLDQIPDEELDNLRDQGFTGLWLIGLWERSYASKRIKQINGNPEAAASAYSLLDYEIAGNLGGWPALENLRKRCAQRGIRLASDMVPNHTGMDGKWVIEHPELFVSTKECPFPQYSFSGENLSTDSRVSIYLEDHYYSKTDCAVCFKRVDNYTGDVTYIYHGNDGTGMPWNDTAQIDFLNPASREAVMQQILKVAANFPIIRFDAAMVLAKKHIRRLWYPEPGHGGDIATRSQHALTTQQFEDAIPNEFWREVVDRCAAEMNDTLLLAEAFWMMEGYFTRTLGMHRVYNSAFMNMLKKEENQKYRDTIKNTIKFDPQILKRYVNFMNNPDEETAVAQFGKGDKYFGVCTLMITMPGLPMFGHGQIEGYEEKYGMEYTRAYRDESPDEGLINRHNHDIFPLCHKRYLFSGVENFLFYDVWNNGTVNENIFAYSNRAENERTVVFYNNKYEGSSGWIKQSCEYAIKTGSGENDVKMVSRTLAEGIGLEGGYNRYCIFREHKSGLWYVRKSDDIISDGMFVSLRGFEYQVYLDVQEVTDTKDGKYAKLNELLKGSGTENLDVAWQEYVYKDLYEALERFASPELFKDLHTLFTPIPILKANNITCPKTEEIFEKIKESAIAYYEMESKFAALAEDATGKEPAETEAEVSSEKKRTKSPTQKEVRNSNKSKTATPMQRYNSFCKQIEFLVATIANAQGIESKDADYSASVSRVTNTAFKVSFDNLLYQGIAEKEFMAETLCAFTMVSSAGGSNCIKWGYNRKLAQLLNKADIFYDELKDNLKRLFILMKIRDMNFGTSGKGKSTYEAAKLFVEGENSWLLSGVNEFNGIKWFNKEKMELSLWLAFAGGVIYSPRILREQIYRLYKTLSAVKETSEYKCEEFVLAVKPRKSSKISSGRNIILGESEDKPKTARKRTAKKKTEEK